MSSAPKRLLFYVQCGLFGLLAVLVLSASSGSAATGGNAGDGMIVPLNRSQLVVVPRDMAEVIVSNPDIADVHVHGAKRLSVIGKRIGRTNIRIFDKDNRVMRAFDVQVSYDLPAVRRALHNFFPYERIAVEMVNTNVALTGEVSNASVAEKALKIVEEFVNPMVGAAGASAPASAANQGAKTAPPSKILNLLQVTSGQQVMLRVRVGEIRRTALKQLGTNLTATKVNGGTSFGGGTGGGLSPFTGATSGFGSFTFDPTNFGALFGIFQNDDGDGLAGMLEALEQQGLFKVLAEPNLVAMSGEQAEFLAGGEFPIPVASGDNNQISVEFKPFGVSVQFIPYVLSENRIRIAVQPEVSEITSTSTAGAGVTAVSVPNIVTRRAKTTVELAPGESFMIAGLIRDKMDSNIKELPGISEIPILSALFRSTSYQREESELVIAVTPYIVDPLKSSDVRMPTDDLRPASMMEMFFYGALGTMSGNADLISQRPNLEGPIGFMVD